MDHEQAPRAPEDVRKFFGDWLDRADAGDWDGFARLLHPDVVLTDPMMPEPARGRAEALERARDSTSRSPTVEWRCSAIPSSRSRSRSSPTGGASWAPTSGPSTRRDSPPTGQRVEIEGVSVLRFRDQLVVEVRLFFDATDAARQLLAAPPVGSPIERVVVLAQRTRARSSRRSQERPR